MNKITPHRQIIHFVGGIKRTIEDVVYVYENEMAHIITASGTEWIINKNNVLAIEVMKPTGVSTESNMSNKDITESIK